MWKQRICMNLMGEGDTGVSRAEQIKMLKKVGFEAFFDVWSGVGSCDVLAETAKAESMIFQSIHAPFGKAADMWKEDEEKGNAAVEELLQCIRDCGKLGVPIVIVHTYIGFEEKNANPPQIGLERFEKVVKAAANVGVQVAFENTEGEEYLDALMRHFADCPNVGFCWDTGHEMCYNYSRDLLADYGHKLIATHINDNLGVRDFEGKITWLDDLHLLPMDGAADWDDIAARLDACNYQGIMTFELCMISKPGRHENDIYGKMAYEEYLAEVYKRACRLAMKRKSR